ncbi:MAG: NTP transferase domain-containing protein [Candidatus Omnitrophica bacterium]|nr:NTP transferase domain-containing protein [Candidatus Omnitrophota bacterium]
MSPKRDTEKDDVVILCGGMGTRLREETETKPKPMVEIGGKPILWHIMKYYAAYGFTRFILALGYKGAYIKDYFRDYNNEKQWEIACVDTGQKTLKGGRIKRLEPHIKSKNFHLTYGDGLGRVDLKRLANFHFSRKKIGTVTAVRPPSRFGELLLKGNYVKEFEEKPQLTRGYINGGFFIFNKKLLEYLTPDENCDLEFGALQKLASEGQLTAYKHDGYWQCMDTARDMNYLNELWENGDPPWRIWNK